MKTCVHRKTTNLLATAQLCQGQHHPEQPPRAPQALSCVHNTKAAHAASTSALVPVCKRRAGKLSLRVDASTRHTSGLHSLYHHVHFGAWGGVLISLEKVLDEILKVTDFIKFWPLGVFFCLCEEMVRGI